MILGRHYTYLSIGTIYVYKMISFGQRDSVVYLLRDTLDCTVALTVFEAITAILVTEIISVDVNVENDLGKDSEEYGLAQIQ